MKKRIIAALLLCLVIASASAATDYLLIYSGRFSEQAAAAARSAQEPPGLILSGEEYEIFRLGYALGYDAGIKSEQAGEYTFREPDYIGNMRSHIFHVPTCYMVNSILFENREDLYCTYQEAIAKGYEPCGKCLKNGPDKTPAPEAPQ